MGEPILIDMVRLNDRLAAIQDGLPKGYKVALLAIHPTNPKGHVLLEDAGLALIRRALDEMEAPDTKVVQEGPSLGRAIQAVPPL